MKEIITEKFGFWAKEISRKYMYARISVQEIYHYFNFTLYNVKSNFL